MITGFMESCATRPLGRCTWGMRDSTQGHSRTLARTLRCIVGLFLCVLTGCGAGGGSAAPAGGTPGGSPAAGPAPASGQAGSMASADLGAAANLRGARPFPADNPWNSDVATAPVDPNSDALIASIGLSTHLHPDFGAGLYAGAPIGIPYVVVSGALPHVPIHFGAYGAESEPGPYPVPPNAPIEGQLANGAPFTGDRHVIVIDRDNNRLYELYNASPNLDQSWNADSGAVFHLDSDVVRPTAQPGWTSADAAGLPIFPGLARYDEASGGHIDHALRFTVVHTRRAYVPPASHVASSSSDPNLPPMGMRVRLKASYVIPSTFSGPTQSILRALKTYGMIVADNGSNWYISGAPDPGWDNSALVSELATVTGADFEVVRMDGLVAVP